MTALACRATCSGASLETHGGGEPPVYLDVSSANK
jgi:hypothetical protein